MSGVNIAQAGPANQTFVRGVGSFATNSYAEGAIAYNADGFYIARPTAVYGNFFDLERIEVLKGPQGTLYGRNATGGAINLISRKPELGKLGGAVGLEAGNFDLVKANAAINIPLGDTLALRASGQIVHRDGYLSDGYDDEKSEAARLHLYWKPSDRLNLLLTGFYSHLGGMGPGSIRLPRRSDDPWLGGADPSGLGQPGLTTLFDPVAGRADTGELRRLEQDGFVDTEVYAITGELNADLGFATLTVAPGYRHLDSSYRTYVPGFFYDNHETSKEYTIETRLGHNGPRLNWVLGAYGYEEDQTQAFYVDQGVNRTGTDVPVLYTLSYAFFGQATYSLTDSLRAIGGLRYTWEKHRELGTGFATAGPPSFSAVYPYIPLPLDARITSSRVNYKAGLEFDVAPQNMVFATVATGFKGGGVINALTNNTYPPERLTAYELGSRNRFLDNRLQVNLEGFYWVYKDKQEGGIRYTPEDGVAFLITPGDATLFGADLDVVFKPVKNGTFTFGGEYLHARYDRYIYNGFVASYNANRTSCILGTPTASGALPVDCSGKTLAKAPKWSGNASYEQIFPLANGSEISAKVLGQFSSDYWLAVDYNSNELAKGYVTVDANLTWTDPSGKLSVGLWAKNLTNHAVYTGGIEQPFKDNVVYTSIRPPRTVGLRLNFDY